MSHVTSIILSLPHWEAGRMRGLVGIHDALLPAGWYGGTKVLEAELYFGAYIYFDLPDFVDHLRGIVWDAPHLVQIIVKGPEDVAFRLLGLVEVPGGA